MQEKEYNTIPTEETKISNQDPLLITITQPTQQYDDIKDNLISPPLSSPLCLRMPLDPSEFQSINEDITSYLKTTEPNPELEEKKQNIGRKPIPSQKALNHLGTTLEEVGRTKALDVMGLCEEDFLESQRYFHHYHKRRYSFSYFKKGSPEKVIWKLGIDYEHLQRLKAIKMLGVTDFEVDLETSHRLSNLGKNNIKNKKINTPPMNRRASCPSFPSCFCK